MIKKETLTKRFSMILNDCELEGLNWAGRILLAVDPVKTVQGMCPEDLCAAMDEFHSRESLNPFEAQVYSLVSSEIFLRFKRDLLGAVELDGSGEARD